MRELIADTANEVFLSTASLWEIAMKHALAGAAPSGMPISAQRAGGYCRRAGYQRNDIFVGDVIAVETWPTLQADPCDRIAIAPA